VVTCSVHVDPSHCQVVDAPPERPGSTISRCPPGTAAITSPDDAAGEVEGDACAHVAVIEPALAPAGVLGVPRRRSPIKLNGTTINRKMFMGKVTP
jgi:hypothetical protein